MDDSKLETRKDTFKGNNHNMVKHREKIGLNLRKNKLFDLFLQKRLKNVNITGAEAPSALEIDPKLLKIDKKYLPNGITSLEDDGEIVMNMLTSKEVDYVKYAVYLLRLFTSNNNNSKEGILETPSDIEKNIITILGERLLVEQDNLLIFEIYWVLLNLTMPEYRDSSHYNIFSSDEMIETFHRHYISNKEIFSNLIWFLCHIVRENVQVRDKIINSKIYKEVSSTIKKGALTKDTITECLWFLSNLLNLCSTVPPEEKLKECMAIFEGYFIHLKEVELISYCIWGFCHISSFISTYPNLFEDFKKLKIIGRILNINYMSQPMYLKPAILFLGNLCTGVMGEVNYLLEINILGFFDYILPHFLALKKDILWALSNITAGTFMHIDAFVNSEVCDKVILHMKDPSWKVRREAIYCISNCLSINLSNYSNKFVAKGVLQILCEILTHEKLDIVLYAALEAVKYILLSGDSLVTENKPNPFLVKFEELGGHTILENLQSYASEDVYELSALILTSFYKTTAEIV